jgi:hypothetical protein
MTFPSVASNNGGNSGGNVTSQVIAMPSGATVGDLVLVFIANDGNATISVTSGTGWTQLRSNAVSTLARVTLYYKVLTGSGDNLTIGISANEGVAYVSYRVTDQHASSAPEASTAATNTNANPNSLSLNPTNWDVEDTLWFTVYGWDGNVSHTTYPTNFASNQRTERWANTGGCGIAASTRNNAAVSEDPGNATLSGSEDWVAFTVAVRPNATVSITPNNGSHAHSAASPSITQEHAITPANGVHAHASDSPALTGEHVITPAAAAHAHTASSPSVLEPPIVTTIYPFGPWFKDTTAATEVLVFGHLFEYTETAASITPNSATHSHAATSPTLTQEHTLTPAAGVHAHSASSPTLTQEHAVAPAAGSHAHTATSPTVSEGTIAVTPNDASHSHAATSPTLTQVHIVTPSSGTHSHTATSPSLTQVQIVSPAGATHAHTATSPVLTQVHTVTPADTLHAHTASSPTVVDATGSVTPNNSLHTHTSTSPVITQVQIITPAGTSHAHTATNPNITSEHLVNPSNTQHAHLATSPTLTQEHGIAPDPSTHVLSSTSPLLTQLHVLLINSAIHDHTATSPDIILGLISPIVRQRIPVDGQGRVILVGPPRLLTDSPSKRLPLGL